jgi:hypothetical protein
VILEATASYPTKLVNGQVPEVNIVMRQIQDTCLLACHAAIEPHLGRKQLAVIRLLDDATSKGFDMTNVEIANVLGWKINCVTGRVKELREVGFVIKSQRRMNPDTLVLNWAWRTKPAGVRDKMERDTKNAAAPGRPDGRA